MAKDLVWYRRNVGYTIGVRKNIFDNIGVTLNGENQFIAIDKDELRDFKAANKQAFIQGLIIEAEAPNVDWETPNALSDDDVDELLKNNFKLKSKLKEIDSESTLVKILEAARAQKKSLKSIELIEARLSEVTGNEEVVNPTEMRGVS